MLCQYKACAGVFESLESDTELGLLAGRPTARFMRFGESSNAWETLSKIQLATATGLSDTELAAGRNILPISLLHQLEAMDEVPLRRLEMLRVEIDSVSKAVSRSSVIINGELLQDLNYLLLQLREMVQECLKSQASLPSLEEIKQALDQLLLRPSHVQRNGDERTQHLYRSLEKAFGRQQHDISIAPDRQHQDFALTSVDCIEFFTGCLLLYVPDRPYDPALKPKVQRDRHVRRRSELENKLQALQIFELTYSGQDSSFRSKFVEKRLAELGAEPEIPMIARPQLSELAQLQAEFSNIVTGIILKSPSPRTLQCIFRQDSAEVQEVKLLRVNIAQAVSRLSGGFRAYEDITKPLIGFLQGLDVGLALSLLAGEQQNPQNQIIQYICEMTPFLGANPQRLAGVNIADQALHRLQNIDPRLHFLKCAGMARVVSRSLDECLVQTMCQTFDSFYQEWKERLGQDQQKHAAESSLYRYRGGEDDNNEADEQEFRRMFPDYDRPYEQVIASKKITYDARDQAQRIASLQRAIFCNTKTSSERLLDLLQNASEDIARLWNDTSKTSKGPMSAENLFSALVLSLDQHREQLLGQAGTGKMYNFYQDANLIEAQKVIAIVTKVQARFLDLHETWPEHATLTDVLRTSSELLALRHTEPIAKILTKAEQLHGYVHEWQVVASQQYTAASLYDQLTSLLISWRRLELSTWARLLDMEDEKCNKDADSWWFIAYEVIIAAPLSMINAGEDIHLHVQQLFSTLVDFVRTSSIGQYTHCLGIVGCFESYLEILVKIVPSLSTVHNAIFNFLRYHARFESRIQDCLRKGRQKLEKDIKEILQLASWKDTNISALRDSAKRFHHKLFKVVRKYRSLLAQSAETFLAQGFVGGDNVLATTNQEDAVVKVTKVDPRAIEIYKSHLKGWESKPKRFTDPTLTAQRMLQMSQQPSAAIDCVAYLDNFGTDLINSIKILQKETPSKATKANSEAVKHLKVRKRQLFAETLKALRHMGFRSNMSVDALSKQSSLSVILANTPAFATQSHLPLASAEFHFHQVLRIIPDLKERSRNHSEDLSHSEVARSMGYLESIVSIILKQRTVLATTFSDFQELDKTSKAMYNSWAPDSYTLKKRDIEQQKANKEVQIALEWLPSFIEAGSVIIEKHGKMGEVDHSVILADLAVWKDKIITVNTALSQLPELPPNILSSRHAAVYQDAFEILEDFKTSLRRLIDINPSSAFGLKQIAKWTQADIATNDLQMHGEHLTSLIDLDDRVSKAVSSMLVVVQRMQEISTTTPSSFDDSRWLTRADSSLAVSLQNLHLREVNELLREAIGQIQYLDTANDGDLSASGALLALSLPILQQFRSIVQSSLSRYAELHRALCKLSDRLAHSFSQVVQEGFCSPAENSDAEAGSTEKLEGGTGLGEGEGAEDISKDIQDDEDLSELAQGMEKDKEKEEIEDQEDAVNMDHDDLEGEMEDVSDKDGDDASASEGEENDIDEETGDVDSLDPSALDEKLWDGKAGETDKEKEGQKAKGKVEKDGQAANDATEDQESVQAQDEEEEEGDDEHEASENGVDEAEEVKVKETEKIDPHLQEGQNLDLPEEMDLDNVDGTDAESASEDSDMEGMSDVEGEGLQDKEADEISECSKENESEENVANEPSAQDPPEGEAEDDMDTNVDEAEDAESPVDTEPDDEMPTDDRGLLKDRTNNQEVDQGDFAPSDGIGLGQNDDQTEAEKSMTNSNAQGQDGTKRHGSSAEDPQAGVEDGQLGETERTTGSGADNSLNESRGSEAFKKLGDALEKWHRQNRQIQEAAEKEATAVPKSDSEMADQEFQHLPDEETEADTQALGAASDEQARALDKNAMDSEMHDVRAFPPEDTDEEGAATDGETMQEENSARTQYDEQKEQARVGPFIAGRNDYSQQNDHDDAMTPGSEEDLDDLDKDLCATHLQPNLDASQRSVEKARQLWSHYESLTRDLSLSLTEQLRLILAPTQATKMRGDFRTGKRLNVKRIIPYIASQYRRDKIWMRRSVPSKRNYQIMLAVDDSKSMDESGSGRLAFEALVLVSKSLSMLEVGQVCVVGFGNEVRVAHEFDKPLTSDGGAQIFQHFSFQQTKTNVKNLVTESITLFQEARRKSFNAGTELWQLELIISDGVCENHEAIRRLVRQAQEEHIMIVFVIVDALLKEESIMDMSQAVFELDPEGETKLKIKRYLDGFPFPYYLVVGDVRELPGVLAQALRQWFSEVVESG